MTKIVATRCQISRLKCANFDFGWGSAQTPLGSLQRPQDPLLDLRGPTSKGREVKGEGKGRGERGERMGGKRGKGEEGDG